MTDPRANTGNMKSVHSVMMMALNAKEGVEVFWTMEEYGSLDACQKEARGFHQTFSSLRNRSRRGEMNRLGELHARDTDAQGAFDGLACTIVPMSGDVGWRAWLGPWKVHASRFNVFDVATGERVTPLGAKPQSEKEQLREKLSKGTITRRDWLRGHQLDAWLYDATGERFYGPENPDGTFRAPTEEEMRELDNLPTGD